MYKRRSHPLIKQGSYRESCDGNLMHGVIEALEDCEHCVDRLLQLPATLATFYAFQ